MQLPLSKLQPDIMVVTLQEQGKEVPVVLFRCRELFSRVNKNAVICEDAPPDLSYMCNAHV